MSHDAAEEAKEKQADGETVRQTHRYTGRADIGRIELSDKGNICTQTFKS